MRSRYLAFVLSLVILLSGVSAASADICMSCCHGCYDFVSHH